MKTWMTCMLLVSIGIVHAQIDPDEQKAADQGDAESQFGVGNEYMQGKDVPKDYAKAMEWFKKPE